MRALAPVLFVLILLLAAVTAVSAQERIHNPQLPQHLVFQWRIETDQVHETWNNEQISITRNQNGLVVYYGVYRTLGEALAEIPEMPVSVSTDQVSLIPFFNQKSISAQDALVLLGDRTSQDVYGYEDEEAVSFSVYFETFEKPQGRELLESIEEALSFEVLPNYNFAYSAGIFRNLEEAEEYAIELRDRGYEHAEVNKFLNGQKVAMIDEKSLFAYTEWLSKREHITF